MKAKVIPSSSKVWPYIIEIGGVPHGLSKKEFHDLHQDMGYALNDNNIKRSKQKRFNKRESQLTVT